MSIKSDHFIDFFKIMAYISNSAVLYSHFVFAKSRLEFLPDLRLAYFYLFILYIYLFICRSR
jgi:hypothetical protein